VIKSQKEKEDSIRKLLNERHLSRYITKNARCSPNVVSRIRKEMACEQLDKKKTLPISAQAFKLFLEKKTLVQVAIILEISAQEVLKIHSEFLLLQNKGKLTEVLDTDQDYQASLLKLNEYLCKNNIDIQHGLNIVDLKEQIENFLFLGTRLIFLSTRVESFTEHDNYNILYLFSSSSVFTTID
jgi:hypothetical protein